MKINYISLLGMLVLASCSNNLEQVIDEKEFIDGKVLKINVTAGDFAVEGKVESRISDNGVVSIFEENDRVGLIVLENGQPIEKNNIPFIYNGNEWAFDLQTAQTEGKSIYYYNSAKTNLTYIMYYPYSSAADNITSVEELKNKFTPKEIQSTEADYRVSDLLVWSKESASALETLNAEMKHAYSSFSLEVSMNGTLDDAVSGGSATEYSAGEVTNLTFIIKGKTLTPYKAEDGTYRYILPADFTGDVTWSYTNEDKNYSNTRSISSAEANKRYVQKESFANGVYTFEKAQVGDFYCVTSDGLKGYLVPKDVNPEILKGRNCLGIVFRVKVDGQDAVPYNDSFVYHGSVVALTDASEGLKWTNGTTESINNWVSSWSTSTDLNGLNITEKTKPQGWANTEAIKAYNETVEESKKVQQIAKLNEFATSNQIPGTSTGWYWPSIFELRTMVCGQGREEMSVAEPMHNDGMKVLESQYSVIQSILNLENQTLFLEGDYWSSTEVSATNAYSFNMKHDKGWFNQSGNGKNGQSYRLKPVFAF